MTQINKRIIIFLYGNNYDTVVEHSFTKTNDKYFYDKFNSLTLKKNDFLLNSFNSSKLNFSYSNGNKSKPDNYMEWFCEKNKNIYEVNYGLIFKIFDNDFPII